MTSDVSQCCKACFIKLHRATTEFANAQQEVICKKGRPSVPYEHASTKSKTRIEKKAMELFHDNINTLKESYNQISGGCGSTLLDITLKAANIPTVGKISEVKAIFFFSQYLIRVPSLRKPSPLGRGLYLLFAAVRRIAANCCFHGSPVFDSFHGDASTIRAGFC